MTKLTANVNKYNTNHYVISGYSTEVQLNTTPGQRHIYTESCVDLRFAQAGGDGITDLQLLSVLIDRLSNNKAAVLALKEAYSLL